MTGTDYLLFRAEGDDIGRFLTLASENDLTIQKFCKSQGVCFGYLPPEEYKRAAKLAASIGIRMKILEKNGISFALMRYRRRLGLILWPAVFTGILFFSQCFLWAVDVSGCETLHPDTLVSAAEKLGLQKGIFLPRADLKGICAQMRQDFPGIADLSLNRIGSRVEIEVSEVVPAPRILPDDPCNLVASRNGIVRSISAEKGDKAVELNQSVAEGQILISGISETPDGKSLFVHARGSIIAETEFDKNFSIQMHQTEKVFMEEKQFRYAGLFGKKIPLFLPEAVRKLITGKELPDYESSSSIETFSFRDDLPLISLEVETRRYFTETEKIFSETEALSELQKASERFETEELYGAEILSREPSASVSGNCMTMTIHYVCMENIAVEKPFNILP